jgi:Asp-tRNA(Asn)/Glu-tRNA(Gln) amidotransferase A subunit family amidase
MVEPPNTAAALTATEARAAMGRGDLTSADLVSASLRRIAERDKAVRAWLAVSDSALDTARAIRPDDPRPLAGIPIGIKDVFDTHDMATTHNSPLFSGNRPARDAPAVAILRAAGAVILGKTDTTEFAAAGRDAVSANPHDTDRTPGGSSAGSAAAVSDFHVPMALGTQTGGSTIRPGSFCGIPAMKPSWGLISTEGVKRYSVSFDTVGLYARSIADLTLLAQVFALPPALANVPDKPTLALCRTPYADKLSPEMADLLNAVPAHFAGRATVTDFTLPERFRALDALHHIVMFSEGAAAFRALTRTHPDLLHDNFHERVQLRAGYTARMLFEAYDTLASLRAEVEALMLGYDAIIAPSAPGIAPLGHGPGNPLFNSMWTAMQLPVINLPMPVPAGQMPMGISLIGPRGTDGQLLALAARLSQPL